MVTITLYARQQKRQRYMLLSCVSHVQLCVTLKMAVQQAPLSLGFSRQEYWSGLPFPLDSVGEGEGGIIWENGIETC